MRNRRRSVGGTSSDSTIRVGAFGSRIAHGLRRGGSRNLVSVTVATVIGVACIGFLGWINLDAARGLNFEFFYLFGCAVVGWFAGARYALLCSGASAICMYLAETRAGGIPAPAWIFGINSLVRLLAFGSIGWLAAQVGGVTRGLEQTVEQRTASLTAEAEEHEETAELLHETVQLFKQFTENISDVLWVTDPTKTQVEYASPAFEKLWGESCTALYESPNAWLEGIHPDDRERVTRAAAKKLVTGEYDEEYRLVRPDGSLRWIHDRAFPVKNEAGAVYRVVGIAEDITERKREEHLQQSQREMSVALSSTSDLQFALQRLLEIGTQLEGIDCGGVYLADPESAEFRLEAHRGLSDSFVARFSRHKTNSPDLHQPSSGQVVYTRHDQISRGPEGFWGGEGLRSLAIAPVRHHGTLLGLLNLGSYSEDEIPPRTRVGIELIASQVAGAIARIRAEESSRRSEAHLRTIINNAPIALLAADAQGILTLEDGQALAAMGVRPGEHVRRSATEVYQDFPLMLDNARRALAGESFSSVVEFDATVFECRYTSVRAADGAPAGFITVATDVTERVRLQREILEISDREQARIGQDVHDGLCQQLIGVALNANSLEQSLTAQQRPEAAAARKISALLDEAITESRRVCRGLYPIRLRTQGLVPALEELAATVRERYQVGCTCEAESPGPHCDVTTATHLYRIAQEALNNALKHSRARKVSIRLSQSQGTINLEVKDDGKGFNAESRRGSGMGLHIMDYRARLVGGSVKIEGDRDGTLVSCCVPLVSL